MTSDVWCAMNDGLSIGQVPAHRSNEGLHCNMLVSAGFCILSCWVDVGEEYQPPKEMEAGSGNLKKGECRAEAIVLLFTCAQNTFGEQMHSTYY